MKFSRIPALTLAAAVLISLNGCRDIANDKPPSGSITYTCQEFVCIFQAEGKNGDVPGNLGFGWNFGDNTSAAGREVEHVFTTSKEFKVTLTVVDAEGNRGNTSVTVNIESNSAAPYLTLVRDVLGSYVYLAEAMPVLENTLSQLQADIEAQAAASSLPVTIQCSVGGSAEITSWEDDGDNTIEAGETIAVLLNACDYGDGAISAEASTSIEGRISDAEYAITNNLPNKGLRTAAYPLRTLAGKVSRAAGSSPEKFQLTSDSIRIGKLNAATERLNSEVGLTELDLELTADNTAHSGGFVFAGSSYNTVWIVTTDAPLQFSENGAALTLTNGQLSLEIKDTQTLTVSVDDDPAYLRLQLNSDADAELELDERLPQSLTVKRLSDY